MDDLVAWLRAQLDDDERVAQQVMAEPGGFYLEAETDDVNIMTVGAHVYRWTPKRVLAEVDAKRRILDGITRRLSPPEGDGGWMSADAETDGMVTGTLRALALPYADRPGYRDEWRP